MNEIQDNTLQSVPFTDAQFTYVNFRHLFAVVVVQSATDCGKWMRPDIKDKHNFLTLTFPNLFKGGGEPKIY